MKIAANLVLIVILLSQHDIVRVTSVKQPIGIFDTDEITLRTKRSLTGGSREGSAHEETETKKNQEDNSNLSVEQRKKLRNALSTLITIIVRRFLWFSLNHIIIISYSIS